MLDSIASTTSYIWTKLSTCTASSTAEGKRLDLPVGDHVKNSTKLGGLAEGACGLAIDGIEQTRHAIEQSACVWMRAHIMERETRKNHTRISCHDMSLVQRAAKCAHR